MKNTNQNKLSYALLPVEKATIGCLLDNGNGYLLGVCTEPNYTSQQIKPFHLYLCSTLPIKEGDYYISCFNDMTIKKWKKNIEYSFADKKIEFTTDPKLIADGVPTIDGNTKIWIDTYPTLNRTEPKSQVNFLFEYCKRYNQKDNQYCTCKVSHYDYENHQGCSYCNKPIQKDNQKGVDVYNELVESLRDKIETLKAVSINEPIDRIRKVWNKDLKKAEELLIKALQSNTGGFSLEDTFRNFIRTHHLSKQWEDFLKAEALFNEREQPKGDIVIECEMESICDKHRTLTTNVDMKCTCTVPQTFRIKLNNNGQPIIYFK